MHPKTPFYRHPALLRRLYTLLILAIASGAAWLGSTFNFQIDFTSNNRNTLSPASQAIVKKIKSPVRIEAYLPENIVVEQNIRDLVGRYQRYKKDLKLDFVALDEDPEKTLDLQIKPEGGLVITLAGRQEKLDHFSESNISNALLRLNSSKDRWIFFLDGHGERSHAGVANHDFGQFGEVLTQKGFKVQSLNLAKIPAIPENIATLVISHPETPPLNEETQLILQYLKKGGHLLWLNDPNGRSDYPAIADYLGIHFLDGVVVDATGQQFGIEDPSFALLTEYPEHPVTQGLKSICLFPKSLALGSSDHNGFQSENLLKTQLSSWTETSPVAGMIQFDPGSSEQQGPLTLALALARKVTERATQQRITILGDADFLANAYIGNGGNLDLGINLMQWLSDSDELLDIPARTAPDTQLQMTEIQASVIGLGFLVALPALLLISGSVICIRRRNR